MSLFLTYFPHKKIKQEVPIATSPSTTAIAKSHPFVFASMFGIFQEHYTLNFSGVGYAVLNANLFQFIGVVLIENWRKHGRCMAANNHTRHNFQGSAINIQFFVRAFDGTKQTKPDNNTKYNVPHNASVIK